MIKPSKSTLQKPTLIWSSESRSTRSRILNLSTRRVGGIRFIKIGRINISVSLSNEYTPLESARRAQIPGFFDLFLTQNRRMIRALVLLSPLILWPLMAYAVIRLIELVYS